MWIVRHRVEVDASAPWRARHFVADALRGSPAVSRLEDAVLLTSELITNAVERGVAPVVLDLYFEEQTFGAEVHDAALHQPNLGAHPPADGEPGGMAIVAAIADEWGVTSDPLGKTVWFRLHAPAA